MQLDAVTAEIRPRSDWEAVDLGLALVRRDFWRCLAVWWLTVLVPVVAAGWWLWQAPLAWLMFFWWWKPTGSRLVLFELSRRLFGERPSWRAAWREIPRAWTRRFFYRFVWARFSPWLPVTLAVEDLENLRGKAYKQRCGQMTRRGEGAVMWIYFMADLTACWFGLALLLLVKIFMPEGQDGAWRMAIESWDPNDAMSLPLLILRTVTLCMMVAMSLTDLFVTGAGFGIYLNNRTWIEGWDVELAFKRLARRLGPAVLLGMALAAAWLPGMARAAAGQADPAQVMAEIKADEAFKVHTIMEKVPDPSKHSFSWEWPQWLDFGQAPGWLGQWLVAGILAMLLGAILWLLWQNRHVLLGRGERGASTAATPAVRVVMGLEVSPESLPADVPGAVRALWQAGRRHEALSLLYRAAISRVMETGRVAIQQSDTEGECLRRVDLAGPASQPGYFRDLTKIWMGQAYGGRSPEDAEVEALCRRWPFVEGRVP